MDYFPFHIWDVILPIDELIFFKMVIAPPTSKHHWGFFSPYITNVLDAIFFINVFGLYIVSTRMVVELG